MDDSSLTKVHVYLPHHWGTGGEALWARSLGGNRYQIDNVPFFAYNLNWGDIVEAIAASADLKPSVRRVLERSGHHTLRVIFAESLPREERLQMLDTLKDLAVTYEGVNAKHFALDLPPATTEDSVIERLEDWLRRGLAEYETSEARVADGFDDRPADDDAS